ncbi:hypothetical protein [Nocardia iowensis]|uniref:Uncharacterized protein n=1 Tax=Nocardia iowensis TaxID=204891 RepID=A0ABX8RP81_NOCIO|nr:hypothetical protein [Nocardia iowensis]QXN90110.1 hypothetical protein KV110_32490 [Nocardia iowensis]
MTTSVVSSRDGNGSAVTIAQLRAIMAVLHVDTESVAAVGDAAVERAELAAVLHALVSDALRRSVVEAPLGQCAEIWSAAATAGHTALADTGLAEQAQFDANWLRQHITTLSSNDAPASTATLLTAAATAIDAATILLAVARNPTGDGSRDAWQAAITHLAYAFHLTNDEYNDLTQPVR